MLFWHSKIGREELWDWRFYRCGRASSAGISVTGKSGEELRHRLSDLKT